jgi:hypothetical protein
MCPGALALRGPTHSHPSVLNSPPLPHGKHFSDFSFFPGGACSSPTEQEKHTAVTSQATSPGAAMSSDPSHRQRHGQNCLSTTPRGQNPDLPVGKRHGSRRPHAAQLPHWTSAPSVQSAPSWRRMPQGKPSTSSYPKDVMTPKSPQSSTNFKPSTQRHRHHPRARVPTSRRLSTGGMTWIAAETSSGHLTE